MLRLAADENFDNNIVRALVRRESRLDLERVQDAGLSGASDRVVLDWWAEEGRILVTHDRATIPKYTYERIQAGRFVPGVFIVPLNLPVGTAVRDLLLMIRYSEMKEWEGRVIYLPL